MEIILFCIAAFFMILGLLGSFLPVLPGVPLSWIGLLLFFLIPTVPMNYLFLSITLVIAIIVYILNLVIPAMGTKRFGGSKKGMIGATIGLVIGIFAPVPFAVIIGPFLGALIGEILNKSNSKTAVRAAFGSFLGLLTSSFMEFLVCVAYLILFVYQFWNYKEVIF
ncbi:MULTISPECIES: DUF456 domain-containing protein [Christiangramia]|uniref:Uncharacterized protein n=1 Tax=Christiangramia flava JLT2011 TaxID=1229726 RepID=A0A1L7I621_9FLAO|nr:DUF456 domain-containing protein [Christiangramia flava]APU68575.1 hypothetical protein GRFL_1851 [Christiangramia flava JLT2011]OSS40638.1 membrane protein [Christiangramia flava JLT2011]